MNRQLFGAWENFRHGKKPSSAVDEFAFSLEQNLDNLAHDIENRTYHHGEYQKITVQEKKRRDLAVAGVRDRVVHRLIYDELTEVYDKTFEPDVWSCRKGKGLHACLNRTQKLLIKHSSAFIWRMDIQKFFDHVDHEILKSCLSRRIRNPRMLYLCCEIINSYNCQSGGGQYIIER